MGKRDPLALSSRRAPFLPNCSCTICGSFGLASYTSIAQRSSGEVLATHRSGSGLQFGYLAIDQLRVEREPYVSMRRGYNIGGTGFSRDFQHRDSVLQSHRAIVDTRQNMTMDIDHI
jgi:hypothetical protein